jgi:hypothetical protein
MAKKEKKNSMTNNSLFDDNIDFMGQIIAKSHKQTQKKKKAENDICNILGDNTLELIESKTPVTSDKKYGVMDWSDLNLPKSYYLTPIELWSDCKIFSFFKSACKSKSVEYKDDMICK